MLAVHRSYRAIRFYPAKHPVVVQGFDQLDTILARALSEIGQIRLDVRDNTLLFDGVAVYGGDDPRDNLAELLLVEGLQSIVFHPGIERAETVAFVEALSRAQETDRSDQDLAALLWELDLQHLTFTVVDPLLEDHSWEGKGQAIQHLREELVATVSETQDLEIGPPVATTLTPVALDDGALLAGYLATAEELATIEQSMREAPDILEQFVEVLTEVLSAASSDHEIESAAHAISDVLSSYLEWSEFRALARAVERLQALTGGAQGRARVVDGILAALTTPESLRKAVYALDGARSDSREDLEELLYLLRDLVYPTLIELLTEAGGKVSRKCLLNVCARGAGVPIPLVASRLADPRWYVVRNMVYLLGSLGGPEVMRHLEVGLVHPDERVRRETVRAMGATGGDQ
ncbi:MAG TPA: hypothetical protein VFD74_04010, partial [Thermoleophilia bacterium]|nr:hypothetical protein [Thermoleophilia bacterium]